MAQPKKVILFIVEGKSEKVFLNPILNKLYDNDEIVFAVVDGDITGDYQVTSVENIYDKLKTIINEFLQQKKLLLNDIYKVIHLIDTDGAFIPDQDVIYHNDELILYTFNSIKTAHVDKVIRKNNLKKKVCEKLVETKKIHNIPYRIYFVSCNLDHVLYNEQNLNPSIKVQKALDLADEFYDNERKFIELIESDVVMNYPTYQESWTGIFNNKNSLRRSTNFNLYFKEEIPCK